MERLVVRAVYCIQFYSAAASFSFCNRVRHDRDAANRMLDNDHRSKDEHQRKGGGIGGHQVLIDRLEAAKIVLENEILFGLTIIPLENLRKFLESMSGLGTIKRQWFWGFHKTTRSINDAD